MNEPSPSTSQNATPFLQIKDLTKNFGPFTALDRVSLDVYKGELVCFLGPSGCGKTTFLRAIAGLDIQTSGTVTQAGKDISALPPSERDFGIVFQSYALFPNLTVEKNISFGLENQKLNRLDIKDRVQELLELVGLADQSKKFPTQLSGGQQQRIALARALATSPGLLLLDEPLSALDAKVRVYLRHEMKTLQRRLGVTTVMVTHDQEEALTMADRIVVMNDGVIEQIGTPTQIYREPSSLFVADFIGAMNQVKGRSINSNRVTVGETTFTTRQHNFEVDSPVVVAIRPEDIVPQEGKEYSSEDNILDLTVVSMEFLGSSWRVSMSNPLLGKALLDTDMSVNAIQRLDVGIGTTITVGLPEDRLWVFLAENE